MMLEDAYVGMPVPNQMHPIHWISPSSKDHMHINLGTKH